MECLNASKNISFLWYSNLEIGFLSATTTSRKLQSVFFLFRYWLLSSPLSPIIYETKGLEGCIPTINKNSINMPLALTDVDSEWEREKVREKQRGVEQEHRIERETERERNIRTLTAIDILYCWDCWVNSFWWVSHCYMYWAWAKFIRSLELSQQPFSI